MFLKVLVFLFSLEEIMVMLNQALLRVVEGRGRKGERGREKRGSKEEERKGNCYNAVK